VSTRQDVIERIQEFVKKKFSSEGSGHDYWHIHRVWRLAMHIAQKVNADIFVVQLGALLHDVGDWKLEKPGELPGHIQARQLLTSLHVEDLIIEHVTEIMQTISFKGASVPTPMKTLEGKVVQDADRLEALGAIGIARAFTYGGSRGRLIHSPEEKPVIHKTEKEYKNHIGTSINHLYEKSLHLKDLMNTVVARELAEKRDAFTRAFLMQFQREYLIEL